MKTFIIKRCFKMGIGICKIVDGILMVISIGYLVTHFALKAATKQAKWLNSLKA